MLQWIRDRLIGTLTVEERQQAIMCKEAMVGEVFKLDNQASLELIKRRGFEVREFHGTRHDN